MSIKQVDIKCDEIKAQFKDLNMSNQEFWAAFDAWTSERADEITSARYRRNVKIEGMLSVFMAAIVSISGIAAVAVSMIH